MNKKLSVAIVALSAVFALTGCSGKTNKKATIEDYEKVDSSSAVSFTSYKKVNSMTDLTGLVLTAEADPNDETERHTAETTANIYSQNNTGSSVIGEYKTDDEVLVLEKMTGTNWYKVVYNGRVAYVQTAVLEVNEDFANSYNNYIGYEYEGDEVAEHDETRAADQDWDDTGETSGGEDATEAPGSEQSEETSAESTDEDTTEPDTEAPTESEPETDPVTDPETEPDTQPVDSGDAGGEEADPVSDEG